MWRLLPKLVVRRPGPRHLDVGAAGEEAAARHLWRAGYRILARNFRCVSGEIDIVAEKNRIVYFVEVKTRSGDAGAEAALTAVDEDKRHRIRKAARAYLKQFDSGDVETRFQVVTVEIDARLKPRAVTLFEGD